MTWTRKVTKMHKSYHLDLINSGRKGSHGNLGQNFARIYCQFPISQQCGLENSINGSAVRQCIVLYTTFLWKKSNTTACTRSYYCFTISLQIWHWKHYPFTQFFNVQSSRLPSLFLRVINSFMSEWQPHPLPWVWSLTRCPIPFNTKFDKLPNYESLNHRAQ
jgi:hypothetical protein